MKTVAIICMLFAMAMSAYCIKPVPRRAVGFELLLAVVLNVALFLFGVASLLSAVWVWTK